MKDNERLRVLLACHVFSRVVQWLYLVVLFVVGYDLTHSARTVAILTFLRFLPNALLLPISGALTDRWNRKLLMVISNGGRALCMVGLLSVHSASMLPVAYVILFVATVLSSLFRPALVATLPLVVGERELLRATSLITQAEVIALAVGPAIAGLLVALGQFDTALLLAAVTFAGCSLVLAFAQFPRQRVDPANSRIGWLEHLGGGFRFLWREHRGVLAGYSLALGGIQVLSGAAWTLSVVLSDKAFGFGGQGVGFLNAAFGLGGFVGGILIGPAIARGALSGMFVASLLISCMCSTLYGFSPLGTIGLVFNSGAGAAEAIAKVSALSMVQSATPNDVKGRVFGAFESVSILAQLVGAIAVGPMLALFGPRYANFGFCVIGVSILLLCIPKLRQTGEVLGPRIFLRSVPALQPVAFRLLDDLAARVTIESFSDSALIVRQGDTGTSLYIIKRGRVEVRALHEGERDVHIANLATMDYFGELALLRNAPRNASVWARGPVDVYRVEGSDFQALMQRVENLHSDMSHRGMAREQDMQALLGGL